MESEERKHALLSPSASHRWLHCTASPRLEALEADTVSEYALEGTLAHAMAAMRLKAWLSMPTDAEEAEIAELYEAYHSGEMDEHVDTYVALVKEAYEAERMKLSHARLFVEVRLDFSDWIPEGFGTSDAIIIGDGVMEVIDLKYGKGVPVDAKSNPQMMIYALGALDRFGDDYDIQTVRMTIVQPRLASVSSYTVSEAELTGWAEEILKPTANEAYYTSGRQQPGDWCRFCRVKGQCRALQLYAMGEEERDPMLMTDAEISEALARIPLLKQWAASVEDHALSKALEGTRYDGYKLVEGRSVRKIVDADKAQAALKAAGYLPKDFMKAPEMRTLTDLEKLVGKKKFAQICGDCIEKPKGKPTLVEMDDKRPEMTLDSEDVFSGVDLIDQP